MNRFFCPINNGSIEYRLRERLASILNSHVEIIHKTNMARTSVVKNQNDLLTQGERRKDLQKHYSDARKDVENLLLQSKDLEKSNFDLIQSNETLKAQMELENQMSALQSQVKEESRAKTSYMTQISLEKKELNILRTFGKSKLEKQMKSAKEANDTNDEQ